MFVSHYFPDIEKTLKLITTYSVKTDNYFLCIMIYKYKTEGTCTPSKIHLFIVITLTSKPPSRMD